MITSVDPEEKQTDYAQFRRRFKAYHAGTGHLVSGKADIPDTWFSIPAVTKQECGYLTFREDGELEFRPYTNQQQNPQDYVKQQRRAAREDRRRTERNCQ